MMRVLVLTWILLFGFTPASWAQQQPAAASPWHVMQDAVVYGMFNHQGGERGDDEFRAPNW